jgi:hypothetical protein
MARCANKKTANECATLDLIQARAAHSYIV